MKRFLHDIPFHPHKSVELWTFTISCSQLFRVCLHLFLSFVKAEYLHKIDP